MQPVLQGVQEFEQFLEGRGGTVDVAGFHVGVVLFPDGEQLRRRDDAQIVGTMPGIVDATDGVEYAAVMHQRSVKLRIVHCLVGVAAGIQPPQVI